jgi:hypothetical protein
MKPIDTQMLTPAMRQLLRANESRKKVNRDHSHPVDMADLQCLASHNLACAQREKDARKTASHYDTTLTEIAVLVKEHPDASQKILDIAFNLLGLDSVLLGGNLLARHDQQLASMRPLAAQHAAKTSTIERARTIASKLWGDDTERKIRIGDMAESAYRTLAAEGYSETLPETVERVKEWIKPIAPEYARKGGRRRKTP